MENATTVQAALVRYGVMDLIEPFEVPQRGFHVGDEVIVRTRRGVEWGQMASEVRRREDVLRPDQQMSGEVMRRATQQDRQRYEEIAGLEKEEFQYCKRLINTHRLPMKLVSVENLFGGEKIIFFFLAEGRVDFRKLVKDLAQRYRTRIEMRQIGSRDEARLMGRIGCCGRELCCRTFLKSLKPVPMKMAKSQKSTLDPSKISGRCGRLKCCLRFEYALYEEFKKSLPRRGATVKTPMGQGVVLEQLIIDRTVQVKLDSGVKASFAAAEIEVVE